MQYFAIKSKNVLFQIFYLFRSNSFIDIGQDRDKNLYVLESDHSRGSPKPNGFSFLLKVDVILTFKIENELFQIFWVCCNPFIDVGEIPMVLYLFPFTGTKPHKEVPVRKAT